MQGNSIALLTGRLVSYQVPPMYDGWQQACFQNWGGHTTLAEAPVAHHQGIGQLMSGSQRVNGRITATLICI